ncbi:hypothetical protein QJQ45_005338 [Haematococcus lacustris]|nr:hypothetical protein QJQ45_005338 [Haematococcus lacustris]
MDPKWSQQRLRLYRAQERALEQYFMKLEEDMAEVFMERHGGAKQLVVFFGAASIDTGGGWGAAAVLRAYCKPWDGKAVGVKPDGGGSIRGQGRVGPMRLHRAAHNRNAEAIKACIASGDDVNEVEAAGNTPLHAAAYEGWDEGVQLLLSLGAKVNASNNAGDTPWHTASHVGNDSTMQLLEQAGASKVQGKVLVQENIPKVSDFYQKECWAHHPLPYADYVEYKRKERDAWEEQRKRNRMIESTS